MRVLLAAALVAAGIGCSSSADDIDHDDTSAFAGMLRATWDFRKGRDKDLPEEGRDSHRNTEFEFWGEAEVMLAKGKDGQGVAAGDRVEFDDVAFIGPVALDTDVNHFRGHFLLRPRFWFSEAFGMEAIGGGVLQVTDTKVEGGGLSARSSDWYLGPKLGIQLNVRPTPPVTLYARATHSFGFGVGPSGVFGGSTDVEVGATVDPVDRVFIFAGWRWAELDMIRPSGESDLFVDLSGPLVGIGVRF